MGIKYEDKKQCYTVSYSRRHPITKGSRSIQRTNIPTKKEAEKVYRQLQNELLRKFYDDRYPYWRDMIDQFIDYYENQGVAKSTIINYRGGLKTHTMEKLGGKKINEISTHEIRELIEIDLNHFSESYKKSMLKFIRAVFNYAIELNIIQRDPTPKLKFKKKEKIKSVLTESEIRTLLKRAREVNNPWFPIWAVACYTGLRNGELYALKWDKVILEKRQIIISRAWTKENGFKETKSGNDRIIEIAESLIPILRELESRSDSEFVLPRVEGWTTGRQSYFLKLFLAQNDLPTVRFHDLRASWATIMLQKGIEPIKVMSMGGWKELKTMQIYIRKSGINIRGITDTLNFL